MSEPVKRKPGRPRGSRNRVRQATHERAYCHECEQWFMQHLRDASPYCGECRPVAQAKARRFASWEPEPEDSIQGIMAAVDRAYRKHLPHAWRMGQAKAAGFKPKRSA